MNPYARAELESEWNAREDYLRELAAEHHDPEADIDPEEYLENDR